MSVRSFLEKLFDTSRTRRGFSPGAYVRRVISNFDLVIRTAIKNKTRKIRFFAGRIVQAQKTGMQRFRHRIS